MEVDLLKRTSDDPWGLLGCQISKDTSEAVKTIATILPPKSDYYNTVWEVWGKEKLTVKDWFPSPKNYVVRKGYTGDAPDYVIIDEYNKIEFDNISRYLWAELLKKAKEIEEKKKKEQEDCKWFTFDTKIKGVFDV